MAYDRIRLRQRPAWLYRRPTHCCYDPRGSRARSFTTERLPISFGRRIPPTGPIHRTVGYYLHLPRQACPASAQHHTNIRKNRNVPFLRSKEFYLPTPPKPQLTNCGPRACGGGPWGYQGQMIKNRWSPRMRGWSPDGPGEAGPEGVVPAHAGVVPTTSTRTAPPPCGPRACGGGPLTLSVSNAARMWSPRMRGWSHDPGRAGPPPSVVPAHAGVVPLPAVPSSLTRRGPRACGGGPSRPRPS